VLFRSAAVEHGSRVIGVILSGMLDDGSAGLWAVKRRGGLAIVQDPMDADHPDMPRNAIQAVDTDDVLPIGALAQRLVQLVGQPVPEVIDAVSRDMSHEVRMAAEGDSEMEELDQLGRRVPFTCPECGGAMWELDDGGGPRFRCHVGHAYSMQTFASEQSTRVEAALWAALRGLEEKERLARRLAEQAARRGNESSAAFHGDAALASANHANVLRGMLKEAQEPLAARPDEHTEQRAAS
jgi:two-component system, chemotaxis family, protein-glutamate methylesterase/glutaminase